MEMSYLLYSIKMQGWMTRVGVYDSDWQNAARYDRSEALALVLRHRDQQRPVLIPVRAADILEAFND